MHTSRCLQWDCSGQRSAFAEHAGDHPGRLDRDLTFFLPSANTDRRFGFLDRGASIAYRGYVSLAWECHSDAD